MSISRLTIDAYKDETCSGTPKSLTVHINPETISRTHPISQAPTTTGKEKEGKSDTANLGYDKSGTPSIGMQTIKFSLMLDSTGLIDGCTNVTESIDAFKDICYFYKGETHGLHYLKLRWGNIFQEKIITLKFRISSIDVEYLMFASNGDPIRAKINCGFTQFMSAPETEKKKNTNSPDLTHMIVAKAGDSLPLLSEGVYKDTKYYMQIARVNGLTSIHELQRGQRLIFPPFEL